MKSIVYINGKANFNLTLYKKYTIRDIKNILFTKLHGYLQELHIRFFLNNKTELEVFNTDKYDNINLKSVWEQISEPIFYITENNREREREKAITRGNFLTGTKDVDRLILNYLSDTDFLQMCNLNKAYSERVCNDSYFRLRTEKRFPETIKYKDYINKNDEIKRVRTWKNHYLNLVKYIDLLQTDYEYIYTAEDKSPELLYLARQSIPKHFTYTKDKAVRWASARGHLPVVKYLVEHGANIHVRNDFALRLAIKNGHNDVVEYLQSLP